MRLWKQSWLNSLKDADGTANVIGEGHANAKVYSDDPTGTGGCIDGYVSDIVIK